MKTSPSKKKEEKPVKVTRAILDEVSKGIDA